MYSFILGFHPFVSCPKSTPASSNSFIVIFANQPPQLVCIRTLRGPGLPFPSTPPQGRWGDEFEKQLSAFSTQPSAKPKILPLAALEALARTLLSVLLTLFGARIARNHALGLQLGAEFRVEQHERSRNAQAHRIGLSSDSAATHVCQHIEVRRGIGRDQRELRADALRGCHKVFIA